MSAAAFRQGRHVSRARLCWTFSVATHALVIIAAMASVFDQRSPRREEAFRWDVAIVQPQPSPQAPVSAPSPVISTPDPQPVTQPASKKPSLAKAEPVVQTMSSRQATKPESAQPINTKQPVMMSQPVRDAQPMIQEAQPQEAVQPIQPVSEQAAQVTHSDEKVIAHSSPVSQAVSRSEALVEPGAADQSVVAEAATSTVQDSGTVPVSQVPKRGSVEESHMVVETAQKTEQAVVSQSTPAVQRDPIQHLPVPARPSSKPDYGWLAQALWTGVEQHKRYPEEARMNHWEGKVILRLTIEQRGTTVYLLNLALEESSGHAILDQHTQDMVRNAFPIEVKHTLSQPQVQLHLPFSYTMESQDQLISLGSMKGSGVLFLRNLAFCACTACHWAK